MAWIESHQSLLTHRKTGRLARSLNVSKITAIGHLHAFWWWCLDNTQDGSLTDCDAAEIADAACWEGDAPAFVAAMVHAGFIDERDGGLMVHAWDEYAGKIIDQRQANAKRQQDWRERQKQSAPAATSPSRNAHVTVTSPLYNGLPYLTVPNHTEPEKKDNESFLSDAPGASDVDSAVPPLADAAAARPPLKTVKPPRGAPKPLIPDAAPALHLARYLRSRIAETLPNARLPDDTTAGLQRWAGAFDLMTRRDKRTTDEIRALIDFAHDDTFWRGVILSPDNLRQHWNQLAIKQKQRANGHSPGQNGANGMRYATRAAPIEPPPPVPAAFYDPWKDPIMDPALMGKSTKDGSGT